MTRTCRVRLGLVAVGTLLATLVTIQPSHSQPPGGGFRGGPPSMPGPPGGISGRPGFSGISGRPPGFPEPPRPPEFPRPPEIPPPGFGGGFGIGGGIGGGQTEWRCGRCGKLLATGPAPPNSVVCSLCGATNYAPGTRPPGGGLGPPPLPTPPPAFDPPPAFNAGPAPPPPLVNGPMAQSPAGGVYVPPSSSDSSGPRMSRGPALRAIGITLGVLLLLGVGIGGVVMAVVKTQPEKPRRRPRRRRRYDDDDD
jgi:hypothetical protein